MKVLKYLLIALLVLFGAYTIWMATLPSEFSVSRSAEINACPEEIMANISDMKTWPEWSAWFELDSTMEASFGDTTRGVGAFYSWTSTMGNGSLRVTNIEGANRMVYDLNFEGQGKSVGEFVIEPGENGGSKITMSFSGEMPFFTRFMGTMMDGWVGPQFETSLENLGARIEGGHKARCNGYTAEVVTVESMPYIYIPQDLAWSEMTSEVFATSYGTMMSFLGKEASNITAPPFSVYTEWDEANQRAKFRVALAVSTEKPLVEPIMSDSSYAGRAVKVVHMGKYEDTGDAHWYADAYIHDNNLEYAGSPWESYVTDPMTEPDTAKWVTEIYYPVK